MTDSEKENIKSKTSETLTGELGNGVDASEAQETASFFADEDEQKTVVDKAQGAEAAQPEVPSPQALLEAQLADWKSKVIYLSAEIENMRKRFARERSELVKTASEEVLKTLLPVFDNISYALKAAKDADKNPAESSQVVAKLVQGVEMTLKHFEKTLEQMGVTPVNTVGVEFDPAHHEAVGQTELEEFGNNIVSTEVQKGFKLYSRVLRPARVLVNKK